MKKIYTTLLLLSALYCKAQDSQWETFIVTNEANSINTVQVNMGLYGSALFKEMPYLVTCGPCRRNSDQENVLTPDEVRGMNAALGATKRSIGGSTPLTYAGSISTNGQKLGYFYVKDTTGLNKRLQALYKNKNYRLAYKVQPDANGDVYAKTLYPTKEQKDWLFDMKIIKKLVQLGDKLDKPHVVAHRIHFKNEESRKSFIDYAERNEYTIGKQDHLQNASYPFTLGISHLTLVRPEVITPTTRSLRQEARDFDARYDGWATTLIKGNARAPLVAKK